MVKIHFDFASESAKKRKKKKEKRKIPSVGCTKALRLNVFFQSERQMKPENSLPTKDILIPSDLPGQKCRGKVLKSDKRNFTIRPK